jgi:hypothetical protein
MKANILNVVPMLSIFLFSFQRVSHSYRPWYIQRTRPPRDFPPMAADPLGTLPRPVCAGPGSAGHLESACRVRIRLSVRVCALSPTLAFAAESTGCRQFGDCRRSSQSLSVLLAEVDSIGGRVPCLLWCSRRLCRLNFGSRSVDLVLLRAAGSALLASFHFFAAFTAAVPFFAVNISCGASVSLIF